MFAVAVNTLRGTHPTPTQHITGRRASRAVPRPRLWSLGALPYASWNLAWQLGAQAVCGENERPACSTFVQFRWICAFGFGAEIRDSIWCSSQFADSRLYRSFCAVAEIVERVSYFAMRSEGCTFTLPSLCLKTLPLRAPLLCLHAETHSFGAFTLPLRAPLLCLHAKTNEFLLAPSLCLYARVHFAFTLKNEHHYITSP